EANDRVRFGANIGVSRLEYDRIGQDNNTWAPLTTSYLQVPWVEPTDANGAWVNTGFLANVVGIEATSVFKNITRRTTGNFYTEIEIIDNLKFKTDVGVDLGQVEETTRNPDVFSPGGSGYKGIWQDNKWLVTNTLNYQKAITEEHYLSILVGHSYERLNIEIIQVEGTGFVSDQLPNVNSASTPSLTNAEGTGWGIESFISRLNYSYLDKYLFEGSFRRDGSSRFGTNNRYGNFWAVSGGWIISEETFFTDVSFIDMLKLKASYGVAGNDQIGNFSSLGLYGAGTIPDYNGNAGIRPSNPPNPDLTWEETNQMDISLSGAFLKNKLRMDVSYYIKDTKGLLLDVPIPYLTGFTSRTANIGEIRNSGIDISLSGDIVESDDLLISTTLNLGFLKNEVTSLPEDNLDEAGRAFVGGSASQRAVEGYGINEFYLIRYKGINPATGEAEWLDANGEVTSSPVAADRKLLGSAIPKLTGSFRGTVKYKDFDFGVLFTFVNGNKVFLGDLRFTDNPNNYDFFNLSTRLLDTWEQPGDNSYAPAFTATTFSTFAQRSSQQLFDGSYIRFKNISFGYNLPKSMLEKISVNNARVYLMGQNVWTFASDLWDFGVEPEINGGASNAQVQGESFFTAPMPKTITVGVNLSF
ncbi:MAG: SusC/RagA family TonB-linked outer membrane protein, partial [Cyclobacteriaceae bacterium]|nr:SusC/RagA family TonB-linked outer membrane protein [Cyclobacteriaceae bacterium]